MAQRKITQSLQESTPDYLVKPKTDFEKILKSRIEIGERLLNTQIINQPEYASYRGEYESWHDYNKELLVNYFNNRDNQYYKDYTYTPSAYGVIRSIGSAPPPLSFQQIVGLLKNDIVKYLYRLKKIEGKLDLIDEQPGLQVVQSPKAASKQEEGLIILGNLLAKFHKAAQYLRRRHADRDTLLIKDEYDVQDLLGSLLQLHFNDVRREDFSPSNAGGNSRVDFVLKEEKIIIEVKMTNDHLGDKEVGSQLLIDIGRYKSHPACEVLVIFVYDKGENIMNKTGLIADLERNSTPSLKVQVFIEPG